MGPPPRATRPVTIHDAGHRHVGGWFERHGEVMYGWNAGYTDSLLKNVTYLGRVQNGDERLVVASGEVDVSTEAGRLLQQAAKEIGRLSVSLQASQNRLRRLLQAGNGTLAQSDEVPPSAVPIEVVPFDRTLPTASVKLQFWAVAGTPHYVVYEPPADYEYILQWSLTGLYNCYLTEKPYPQGWITGHPTG